MNSPNQDNPQSASDNTLMPGHQEAPRLCVNNCGFYGSPATQNLCSKCYQEQLKHKAEIRKQANQASSNDVVEVSSAPLQTATPLLASHQIVEFPSSSLIGQPSAIPAAPCGTSAVGGVADLRANLESLSRAEALPTACLEAGVAEGPTNCSALSDSSSDLPEQTNRSRCWRCTKKVGLLGFTCRCGFTFCGQHRYADTHECHFDYKAMARSQLDKANKKVVAEKVKKI